MLATFGCELHHCSLWRYGGYSPLQYLEKLAKKPPHLFSQQRVHSSHPNEQFIDLANGAYICRQGTAFPGINTPPRAHMAMGWGQRPESTSPTLCWKQPLCRAPSPLTQRTHPALPPHKQLHVQTWVVSKFMAFYFPIFPTYCHSAGL